LYTEGRWNAYPFQTAIMDCISHDDIVEVDVMKSARIGYTKMILAAIGYFAEHKKRNPAIWQPSDADSDEFTKTELESMLRDVPVMERVFPSCLRRHKDNTLKAKSSSARCCTSAAARPPRTTGGSRSISRSSMNSTRSIRTSRAKGHRSISLTSASRARLPEDDRRHDAEDRQPVAHPESRSPGARGVHLPHSLSPLPAPPSPLLLTSVY
jgi:Phage terminase large subunit (GpA)